jgi:hypothetical protein
MPQAEPQRTDREICSVFGQIWRSSGHQCRHRANNTRFSPSSDPPMFLLKTTREELIGLLPPGGVGLEIGAAFVVEREIEPMSL